MKTSTAFLSLSIVCLLLVVSPAMAGTLYDNGPINGDIDAWTISAGFLVSDSFVIPLNSGGISDLHVGLWLFPGESLVSLDIAIGSTSFGGVFSPYDPSGSTNLGSNSYGYTLWQYDFTGPLAPGYGGAGYLTLTNAVNSNPNDVCTGTRTVASIAEEPNPRAVAQTAHRPRIRTNSARSHRKPSP